MKKRKPSILIIRSEQQSTDTIAAYKNVLENETYHCQWLKTPNLDKIVINGYSFLNFILRILSLLPPVQFFLPEDISLNKEL